jgi:lactoylglutathione lyase
MSTTAAPDPTDVDRDTARTVRPPGLATGHVGLNVADLDRSTGFSTAVLGLAVLGRSDADGRRYAFLGADDVLLLTLWQQADQPFDPAAAGLHHRSFQVDDVEAVRAVQARIVSAGGALVHDRLVAHGEGAGSGGVFFTDPDGTRLEVFAPTGPQGTAPAVADGPTCGFF